MAKPIVISGIQPSGRLHIGNYLGALKNFVDLQNSGKYTCFFFVADYHSLTETFNAKEKRAQITDLMASYLASGLSPKKSVLFTQSALPAHTELAWILNTITPMGELKRMTQFKDKRTKVAQSEVFGKVISGESNSDTNDIIDKEIDSHTNVGLFEYPVLMAADILMYDASVVPTGDDQDQHLELARTLARKFNSRFGETFREPKNLHTTTPRVMSLDNPAKKMSKSSPAGCVFIDDTDEVIRDRFMRAVTDSGHEIAFDPETKPGISNLLTIASAVTGRGILEIVEQFKGATSYADFKKFVAETVVTYFAPIREAKLKLMKKPSAINAPFVKGSKVAGKIAEKKMKVVKKAVGLE